MSRPRYRYEIVTRPEGTFGLDFHADVDEAIDEDARAQLDALGGPSSLAAPRPPAADDDDDGLQWSASPDASAAFDDPDPAPRSDWDLRPPPPGEVRRISLTPEQKAAALAADEE